MSDKEQLQKKLENDVEVAQVKLAEIKATIARKAASVQVANSIRIEVFEQRIEEAKQRLFELKRSSDSLPEQLVEGVEDTWRALQDSLQDAVSTFEGEH